MEISADYSNRIPSKRRIAENRPIRYGYEKEILSVAPQPADDNDTPAPYSDDVTTVDATAWIKAREF